MKVGTQVMVVKGELIGQVGVVSTAWKGTVEVSFPDGTHGVLLTSKVKATKKA